MMLQLGTYLDTSPTVIEGKTGGRTCCLIGFQITHELVLEIALEIVEIS
jgi:hypothetical protein